MPNQPPFLLATRLQTQLIGILLAVDVFDVLPKEARLINSLRREVADARLDIRDYEMSQTRDEQIENAKVAKKRLDKVREQILAVSVSEYNVFSAVDVAQLTAGIEQIIDRVK